MANAAVEYAEAGFRVFPVWGVRPDGSCHCPEGGDCGHPGKHPVGRLAPRGLNDATDDPEQVAAWWRQAPAANVGIATGGHFFVLDLDVKPDVDGREALRAAAAALCEDDELPPTAEVSTGGGGVHLWFAKDEDVPVRSRQSIRGPDGDRLRGVDVRGEGGYVVAPPSAHASGGRYAWARPPEDMRAAPPWLLALAAAGEGEPARAVRGHADVRLVSGPPGGTEGEPTPAPRAAAQATQVGAPTTADRMPGVDPAEVRDALAAIPPNEDRETWVEMVSMPLHDAFRGSEEGFRLWHEWCATGEGLLTPNGNPAYGGEAECRTVWRSFSSRRRRLREMGSFWRHARHHGWRPPAPAVGPAASDSTVSDQFTTAELEEAERAPQDPGAWPAHLVSDLRGPLGDLVQMMMRANRRPDPAIAFAAALGFFGGAIGRRMVGPHRARPNFAIAMVAPSGAGKDIPQQVVKNLVGMRADLQLGLMSAVAYHESQLDEQLLNHEGQVLFLVDEYGTALGEWQARDGPSRTMSAAIRRLIGHGEARYQLAMLSAKHTSRKENRERWDAGIFAPNLMLVGFLTPRAFRSAFTAQGLEDGFLGRHLVICTDQDYDLKPPECKTTDIPESVMRWVGALIPGAPVPLVGGPRPHNLLRVDGAPVQVSKDMAPDEPVEIGAEPEAQSEYEQFCHEVDLEARSERKTGSDVLAAVLSRTPGQVNSLAFILAVAEADDPTRAIVAKRHVDLAREVVLWSAHYLGHAFRLGAAEGPKGAAYVAACELVRKHGTRARSELARLASIGPHMGSVWMMLAANPEFLMDDPMEPMKSRRVTTKKHFEQFGHRRNRGGSVGGRMH